jgi:hypothetical protein
MRTANKATESHIVHFPRGEYWIGDLCYVLGDRWDEVCEHICSEDWNDGLINLDGGLQAACFGTAYGDGIYEDNWGNSYGVDAGIIGCVLTSAVKPDRRLGHVHKFPTSFDAFYQDGKIHFGHVVVDTDPEYDEEGE